MPSLSTSTSPSHQQVWSTVLPNRSQLYHCHAKAKPSPWPPCCTSLPSHPFCTQRRLDHVPLMHLQYGPQLQTSWAEGSGSCPPPLALASLVTLGLSRSTSSSLFLKHGTLATAEALAPTDPCPDCPSIDSVVRTLSPRASVHTRPLPKACLLQDPSSWPHSTHHHSESSLPVPLPPPRINVQEQQPPDSWRYPQSLALRRPPQSRVKAHALSRW